MEEIECVVIGAGVIGLAIANALGEAGRETLILERHPTIGTQISARNSEVMHAGIYYSPDSLKARLCVRGRRLLYEFCAVHGVRHRRCGKLIAATSPHQIPELERIAARGLAAGVDDLRHLTRTEARALEPELECAAALMSPSTGIVDGHQLMNSLLGLAESRGATLATRSPVEELCVRHDGIGIRIGADQPLAIRARWLINAAGLDAAPLAGRMQGFPAHRVPAVRYAKGSYFASARRAPFSHLIYPVPEPGGLGVHLTLDQAGQARFGPDVEWTNELDFSVDENRAAGFYAAIRRYWPGLKDGSLVPAYAGIRPKLSGPGEAAADFRIDGPAEHGVPGVVNLFGIESPGLTSCLAIAELVAQKVGREPAA